MTRIVSGRFETLAAAEGAVGDLNKAGCPAEHINLFFNPPPGQHGAFPVGGDEHADPEARGAERKTLTGAAIGAGIGVLAGSLAGPLGAVAGAAVGGYTGSLAGTLSGLGNEGEHERRRPSGVMVAVNASSLPEARIIETLRAGGADPVEAVDGEWLHGEWTDFDPVEPPHDGGRSDASTVSSADARARAAIAHRPQVVYRVVAGGQGKWNVFEGDLGKLLSEFPERQEALDYAASLASTKSLAVVEVYRAGGVLESSRVYSDADPYSSHPATTSNAHLERKSV
jgi:hypothetical protein